MLEFKQISLIERPNLIGTAKYGISISPESFAKGKLLIVEKSFDDLGEFSFIGLNIGGVFIAMRRHVNTSKNYSYISLEGSSKASAKHFIANFFELDETEIIEFDEYW